MTCEYCGLENHGNYGSGRFCTIKCAKAFATSKKREEINKKVSKALKKRFDFLNCKICQNTFEPKTSRELCCSKECKYKNKIAHIKLRTKEQRSENSAKGSKGKYVRNPQSLLDISGRTISKIIQRLGIGCSRCSWNEAPGDIHHINGRKIPQADHHSNLTYLCPNCHRLFHHGKIGPTDVVSLEIQIGDSWKKFYYG